MNILKPSEISVFDNRYVKPSQSGLPLNWKYSVSVIFCVSGTCYSGQYNFETGHWHSLPGGEKMHDFIDNDVEYWFFQPGTKELFDNFAQGIKNKEFNKNELSRLDEYVPNMRMS